MYIITYNIQYKILHKSLLTCNQTPNHGQITQNFVVVVVVHHILKASIKLDPFLLSWRRGIPHQVVTELRVCDSLLQLQRLQEFPDGRMGAADQALKPVVPYLCDVGASGR